MTVYMDLVMLLNFSVDLLLLIAANRLTGYPQHWGRLVLAAAFGGVYSGVCLLPGVSFLGRGIWPAVFLAGMAVIAYGLCGNALRRGLLFSVLNLALGGMAVCMGAGGIAGMIACALGMCFLCYVGFRRGVMGKEFMDITLEYMGRSVKITALRDTGNTLVDPITGEAVLVVSCDVAQQLVGLQRQQLCAPVETLTAKPLQGLRLLPYATVGGSGDFLLAVRMDCREKCGKCERRLVAFSPERLDREGAYHALTGGAV